MGQSHSGTRCNLWEDNISKVLATHLQSVCIHFGCKKRVNMQFNARPNRGATSFIAFTSLCIPFTQPEEGEGVAIGGHLAKGGQAGGQNVRR